MTEIEQKLNRGDLIYKTGNKRRDKTYDFQKFKTIQSFGREIVSIIFSITRCRQVNLQDAIYELKESTKGKTLEKKEKKTKTLNNAVRFLRGKKKVL